MIASCFMALFHLDAFSGTIEAANSLIECSVTDIKEPESLFYPSQLRQMKFFDEILNGFIPLSKPMILQRIVINGMPDLNPNEMGAGYWEEEGSDDEKLGENKL